MPAASISPAQHTALAAAAQAVAGQAYAPYSQFAVGAAVLAEDGRIFAGCNVENASYGLGICAERNAIFQAAAAGVRRIRCVAIFTPTEKTAAPCGACRQVINEFGPEAVILSRCEGTDVLATTLDALLPQAFGPSDLAGK